MRRGFPQIVVVLLVIVAILYFTVEPGSGRDNAEQIRQSVREGVHNTKERLDHGFEAAKKDVETIKSDLKEGDRDDREPEPRRP
ncbi:MAG: hypothetical protein PSY14_17595 [bacterium]|nr:hypothetical protein [bacterium]